MAPGGFRHRITGLCTREFVRRGDTGPNPWSIVVAGTVCSEPGIESKDAIWSSSDGSNWAPADLDGAGWPAGPRGRCGGRRRGLRRGWLAWRQAVAAAGWKSQDDDYWTTAQDVSVQGTPFSVTLRLPRTDTSVSEATRARTSSCPQPICCRGRGSSRDGIPEGTRLTAIAAGPEEVLVAGVSGNHPEFGDREKVLRSADRSRSAGNVIRHVAQHRPGVHRRGSGGRWCYWWCRSCGQSRRRALRHDHLTSGPFLCRHPS